jgi:hypothetical protein
LLPTDQKEMTIQKLIVQAVFAVAVILVFSGCQTSPEKAVVQFRRHHAREAAGFTYIYPVNTEMFDIIFRMKSATISGIGHSLKDRFSDNSAIASYASIILKQENVASEEWQRLMDDLELEVAQGGVICEFEWKDGTTREVGLLVLKGRRIVRRQPWFTDHSIETNKPHRK